MNEDGKLQLSVHLLVCIRLECLLRRSSVGELRPICARFQAAQHHIVQCLNPDGTEIFQFISVIVMGIDMLFGVDFYGPFSLDGLFEEDFEKSQPRAEQSSNEEDAASDQASNYKRRHLN